MKCHEIDSLHQAKYSEAKMLFVEPDNTRRKVIETLLINKNKRMLVEKNSCSKNLLVF